MLSIMEAFCLIEALLTFYGKVAGVSESSARHLYPFFFIAFAITSVPKRADKQKSPTLF